MTVLELEQLTRDYLTGYYKRKYIGKIEIIKLDPVGYNVRIGRGVSYLPYIICAELEDEKFLKYLKLEIKNLHLENIGYGEVNLRYPYICPTDTSCKCHDKR